MGRCRCRVKRWLADFKPQFEEREWFEPCDRQQVPKAGEFCPRHTTLAQALHHSETECSVVIDDQQEGLCVLRKALIVLIGGRNATTRENNCHGFQAGCMDVKNWKKVRRESRQAAVASHDDVRASAGMSNSTWKAKKVKQANDFCTDANVTVPDELNAMKTLANNLPSLAVSATNLTHDFGNEG
jgi:hypothetical protein